MKERKFSELSIEELYKKKKTLTSIMIGFGVVMVILYAILLYLIFKSESFALIAIIPASLLSIFPTLIILGQVNSEIKLRNSK